MRIKKWKERKLFFSNNGTIEKIRFNPLFLTVVLCLIALFVIVQFGDAAPLACSFNATGSCAGGTFAWYSKNDSGGYYNAHVQNVTNTTFPQYSYGLCCTSTSTLTADCGDATSILRIFNVTNSHAQIGTYSAGQVYGYPICLSAQPGFFSCDYETNYTGSACTDTSMTCLGSLASSDSTVQNQTNAHVGPCVEYPLKICCKVSDVSKIFNILLNSTYGTNYAYENLTVYFSENVTAGAGFSVTNITDWRKNGASIAVLNLAFNLNVSAAGTGIRDYSTYGNNATLVANPAVPLWISAGKVGGGYQFDGNGGYINVSNSSSLNSVLNNFTLSAWVQSADGSIYRNIVMKLWDGSSTGTAFAFRKSGASNQTFFDANISGTRYNVVESSVPALNTWNFYAATYNGTLISFYQNGVLQATQAASGNVVSHSTNQLLIGAAGGYSAFNGSIDEIQLFNISLSAQQILDIYNAGVANHSVWTMDSSELYHEDNWTVALTPNDAHTEGVTTTSNNVQIQDSLANITLVSPPDGNGTTNRTPTFVWNATVDRDGDTLTYEINMTAVKVVNQPNLCSDSLDQSGIATTNFTPSRDLRCLYDDGYVYNWTVRAFDGFNYSSWSQYRILNLTSLIVINATTNVVSFGSLNLLQSNDTTNGSPPPFQLENQGNVYVNVTAQAGSLWSSLASPNQNYQYRVNNLSGQIGAFNATQSLTNFTNVSPTPIQSITQLNYSLGQRDVRIDILVQVPASEQPGDKNSTMTFTASLGYQP